MEMTKLQQDYQNGKITLEELSNKMKELTPKLKEESTDVIKKILLRQVSKLRSLEG